MVSLFFLLKQVMDSPTTAAQQQQQGVTQQKKLAKRISNGLNDLFLFPLIFFFWSVPLLQNIYMK